MATPSSPFDPDAFMNQTADAGSTTFEPIPAKEYTAIIDDAAIRVVNGRDGDRVIIDCTFLLQDEEVKARLGRERLSVKSGIFLDLTSNGAMDMAKGKNVRLNQLREALGQNKPGWKPTQLKGAGPLKVQVVLRPDKSSDAIFNDIKSFGKIK